MQSTLRCKHNQIRRLFGKNIHKNKRSFQQGKAFFDANFICKEGAPPTNWEYYGRAQLASTFWMKTLCIGLWWTDNRKYVCNNIQQFCAICVKLTMSLGCKNTPVGKQGYCVLSHKREKLSKGIGLVNFVLDREGPC